MKCCTEENNGFMGSVFSCLSRSTTALYNAFRDNRPVQALTAGAATLAMLPIYSRQLKKLEEDTGAANVHSDDFIYPMLLINMLLVSPFLVHYFLTKLVKHHSNDNYEPNEGSYTEIAKKSLVLYTSEAVAITPFLGYLLPEGYNYAVYSILAAGLGLASLKTAKDYISAINQNLISVYSDLESEQIPFFAHITRTNFVSKAISSLTPAALMAFILYAVELNNSKTQNSEGFDVYVAWATAYVLPLVISNCIQNSHILLGVGESLEIHDGSDSMANKAIVNTLCALSMVGRGICYASFTQEFFEGAGLPPNVSLGLSIVLSGIGANIAATLVERKELMPLLQKLQHAENIVSCQNVIKALFVALEGVILSSPFVIEQLSVLIKQDIVDPAIIAPIIGLPFAAVEAAYAGSVLHKAVFGHDTIPEQQQREFLSLMGDAGDTYNTADADNPIL